MRQLQKFKDSLGNIAKGHVFLPFLFAFALIFVYYFQCLLLYFYLFIVLLISMIILLISITVIIVSGHLLLLYLNVFDR